MIKIAHTITADFAIFERVSPLASLQIYIVDVYINTMYNRDQDRKSTLRVFTIYSVD